MAAAEEHELVAAAFDKVKTAPAEPANPVTAEEEIPEAPTPAQTETKPDQQPPAEAEEKTPPTTPTKPEPKPEETTEEPEPKPEETTEEPEPKAEGTTEEPEPESATEESELKAESTAEEPEPEPESAVEEPEPKVEGTTEEPEPEQPTEETEPESAVGTEKTEPEAEAEPATVPEADAEPVIEPEAEVAAPVKAEAEPEADAEAEADEATVTAEATTAPQAADGEEAPQGPPAADDESRTGGAGGNPDAEGEAEADPQPAPAPQATREPETDPQPAPAPAPAPAPEEPAETEPKPQPATPLTRVRNRAPSLTTAYKAATTTLKKTDLTGTRAKVYLVLDRSASMRPYYKDGSAQALADQTLALAAHLDPEAAVHVVFFSTEVDGTTDLTLAPDHETKIDDVHAGLGRMGRTSYHAAVQAVVAHYEEHAAPGTPALVVFQTDGAPDAKTPATQSLTEAATRRPALFFSFVAFGDHDNKAFDYLRKLKTGNTSFFHAGPTPRELTDTELYEGVLATWRP
ncbi:Toxic cation resistance protein [Streptomyces corchorusii]|uniref:Toxic cation resistance protein n=1 Tax=Streptomyces corchorusii TaxID=1903 RepID=A0A101QCE5_STRCK|nr:Toxic cation resistance protein [Streptomyces corchorusii]